MTHTFDLFMSHIKGSVNIFSSFVVDLADF